MTNRLCAVGLLLVLGGRDAGAQDVALSFDKLSVGRPPDGFAFAVARGAAPDRWTVERQGDDVVLAHAETESGAIGSALAVIEGAVFETFEVSTRIRLASGQRAGGLVWRYEDAQNYHFVVLDLVEQRLDAYRVVRGNHVRYESEDDLELDPEAWYSLRVVQDRGRVRVYLGGIRVLDERRGADAERGGVGVWSAGGSTTWFDDIRVRARTGRRDENPDR